MATTSTTQRQDSGPRKDGESETMSVYEPSERDIKQECQRFQESWSAKQESKHAVSHRKKWTVPVVRLSDLPRNLSEWVESPSENGEQ